MHLFTWRNGRRRSCKEHCEPFSCHWCGGATWTCSVVFFIRTPCAAATRTSTRSWAASTASRSRGPSRPPGSSPQSPTSAGTSWPCRRPPRAVRGPRKYIPNLTHFRISWDTRKGSFHWSAAWDIVGNFWLLRNDFEKFYLFTHLLRQSFCLFTPPKTVLGQVNNSPQQQEEEEQHLLLPDLSAPPQIERLCGELRVEDFTSVNVFGNKYMYFRFVWSKVSSPPPPSPSFILLV